jgi:hypothetical protein
VVPSQCSRQRVRLATHDTYVLRIPARVQPKQPSRTLHSTFFHPQLSWTQWFSPPLLEGKHPTTKVFCLCTWIEHAPRPSRNGPNQVMGKSGCIQMAQSVRLKIPTMDPDWSACDDRQHPAEYLPGRTRYTPHETELRLRSYEDAGSIASGAHGTATKDDDLFSLCIFVHSHVLDRHVPNRSNRFSRLRSAAQLQSGLSRATFSHDRGLASWPSECHHHQHSVIFGLLCSAASRARDGISGSGRLSQTPRLPCCWLGPPPADEEQSPPVTGAWPHHEGTPCPHLIEAWSKYTEQEYRYIATPIIGGIEAHSPRRYLLAAGCRELASGALPSSSIEKHCVLPPVCCTGYPTCSHLITQPTRYPRLQ